MKQVGALTISSVRWTSRCAGEERQRVDADEDDNGANETADLRHATAPEQRCASAIVTTTRRYNDLDVREERYQQYVREHLWKRH